MHATQRLFLAILAAAFMIKAANAATTVFNNRAAWQNAAGPSQTIDFSSKDDGNPITNPPATVPFNALTLKGVTFINGMSADNQFIYAFQGTPLRVNLPANTTAFSLDWAFMAESPGISTFRLSTGETFHPTPQSIPYSLGPDFFGVTSDQPIEWAEFSLSSITMFMDNFSFVAHAMKVPVDIKPGSDTNPIKPGSDGVIPVALLSSPGFAACSIDWQTLRFGRTGTEAQLAGYSNGDVNGDGLPDLMLQFRTADTGLACGDSSGVLTGQTVDGQKFRGSDVIRILGCSSR